VNPSLPKTPRFLLFPSFKNHNRYKENIYYDSLFYSLSCFIAVFSHYGSYFFPFLLFLRPEKHKNALFSTVESCLLHFLTTFTFRSSFSRPSVVLKSLWTFPIPHKLHDPSWNLSQKTCVVEFCARYLQ
jgi:hypothetical protein